MPAIIECDLSYEKGDGAGEKAHGDGGGKSRSHATLWRTSATCNVNLSVCNNDFFFFFHPPGDPGKKSLSSIHFRLCTSYCPSTKRRLGVNLAPSV